MTNSHTIGAHSSFPAWRRLCVNFIDSTKERLADKHDTAAPCSRGLTRFCLCLCLLLASQSACFQYARAEGLSNEQITLAHTLIQSVDWPMPVPRVSHPLGVQTLSVEKQERKHSSDNRWVNVFQYHYALESARLLVVDLELGVVDSQTPIKSPHLPLNHSEIEFAAAMLENDALLMERLQAEQSARGMVPFSSLAELDLKASIFEPMNATHPCASERCALLSLFDQTSTVFSIEPVIRLQSLVVDVLRQQ